MAAIKITSGSDANLQFAFKDSNGIALTVSNPQIIEAGGALSERTTVTLTDGVGGIVNVFIEGTDPLNVGRYPLRVQVELSDGNTLASKQILIDVI